MLALLGRMLVAAPLIYIGVLLLRDPAGSYDLLNLTAVGLRNFENRVRQQMPLTMPAQAPPLTSTGRLLLQFLGGALITLAIAYLLA